MALHLHGTAWVGAVGSMRAQAVQGRENHLWEAVQEGLCISIEVS